MVTNSRPNVRKRAVRLTPKGLAILTEALTAACEGGAAGRKITREERARLLDVSVVTAQRIVNNEGVDRSSLVVAFKNLAIDWKESYCEYIRPVAPAEPIVEMPRPQAEQQPKKTFPWIGFASGLAACAAVTPLFVTRPRPDSVVAAKTPDRIAQEIVIRATDQYNAGQYDLARKNIAIAEDQARELKNAPILANAEIMDGQLEAERGNYERARALYLEAITLRRSLHEDINIPPLLESLADVEVQEGKLKEARSHLLECLTGFQTEGDRTGVCMASRDLGSVAARERNLDEANRWFASALDNVSAQDKPELVADIQARQALVLRDQHRFGEARAILIRTYCFWQHRHHERWIAESLFQRATVEAMSGNPELAANLFEQSKTLYLRVGDKPGVSECDEWSTKSRPQSGDMIAYRVSSHRAPG